MCTWPYDFKSENFWNSAWPFIISVSLVFNCLFLVSEMDSYEKCAGDALRACTIREEGLMNQGTSDNFLSAITSYIKCFKEQGKSCDAVILHHMITIYKVYKKHLGEKKGEFGKMVHKISLPD